MILIDIVGGCNAKCPLCVTARTTFGKRIEYMAVADFERTIDRLVEMGFAPPGMRVGLYNWAEPILHPDLNGISKVLRARGLVPSISTNSSKKTTFTDPTDHFDEVVFSLPGWSQASYDKIHGLKFDRVVANMEATIANMRATGFRGRFLMSFHTYQFNILEIGPAANWCSANGVVFQAYSAYINDYEPMKQYLSGDIPMDTLKYFSKTLMLNYVDDLIASQPKDWRCPQWDKQLTLNHKSEVLLCCVVSPGHESYSLGSIFDLGGREIMRRKRADKECGTCMKSGHAYWAHNPNIIASRGPQQSSTAPHRVAV